MAARQSVKVAWPFYIAAILVAAVVAGAVATTFSDAALEVLGIPDPGIVTTFGLPAFRATVWLCAALATGSLLFSAFLFPPEKTGPDLNGARLSVDGVIAAHTAGWASISVAVISFLMIPLVLSDVSGTPLGQVLFNPGAWSQALSQVADARVWLAVGVIAAIVGVGALVASSWWSQVALFGISLLTILPIGLTGHSAAGGAHDYGTNSLIWHLVFMLIWVGGLMALVAHGRRLGPHLQSGVQRYSRIALFAFLVMTVSGVINASLRVHLDDLFSYAYGMVLVAKAVGLVLLGVIGFAHRQMTIPKLGADPKAFNRLATGEVLTMAVVCGLAVTLGRTPPPPPRVVNLDPMELNLGYELIEPLSLTNWLTQWRFELIYSVIALLLAGYYLHLTRRVVGWKPSRTAWWLLGCATIVITLSSGLGMHMAASYSAHMVVHMLLAMGAPVSLVLGAPLTLIKQAYPAGEFNPRAWAESFERSKFLRVITWPPVSLIQFIVSFYILYISIPLYELMISEHAGHVLMNAVFLVSGYFYFWELIGPDHIEGRPSAKVRLLWLWISMPFHLFMGVYLMQLNVVMAENFYTSLNLPWDPDLLADQKVGGGIAWASGSFPLALVFGILFYLFWKEERDETRDADRRADENDDEEWRRYNEMLARYSDKDRTRN